MMAARFETSTAAGAPYQPAIVALSLQLRDRTAAAHRDVENRLGLPQSIATLAQYRDCIERFYRFYVPLEACLQRFDQWPAIGIDFASERSERRHAAALALDLTALGIDPLQLEMAPESSLPLLPDFAHALGALYVTQGSTLGAQFILRHLEGTLGAQIAGADAFFGGRGTRTGALWREFQKALDLYGVKHPDHEESVVMGSKATFLAVGTWMQP